MKKFSILRVASIFAIGATSLFLASCGHKDSAVIKAVIQGASEKEVILNMLNINKLVPIDTLKTDKKGFVKYKVKLPYASPNFYYMTYHGTTVASLLLVPGDRASITVDTLGKLLKISGSEESILLGQVNDSIARAQKMFDSLTVQLLACDKIGDKGGALKLRYELGHLYVKQKQYSIKSILRHPHSFTNVTQLYRQFNENLPLFAQLTDGIYYKQVCDSLKPLYPNSPYIKVLEGEVTRFNNYMEFNNKMQNAGETAFPDIALPDISSNTRHLNTLLGRPFMLLFWSATDNAQKMLNAELLQLYNRYKGKGFQIYEVCVDTDKTNWASIVKNLPWINVCDGMGASSVALSTYNVSNVPSMFLFDKDGTIAGRDIFNMKNLDIAISKL